MNNINKFINDSSYRFYILRRISGLKWLSDENYIKLSYKMKMGKDLDLERPQLFSEKMQWLKLYNRDPRYSKMVDKYQAKEYVKNIIGEEYIVPTYGIWDSFNDIDFEILPEKYVLKCTHDSGGLAICRDKRTFDIEHARKVITHSLKQNYYWAGREWPYKNVKPRILAEKYLQQSGENNQRGLIDYKFFCFNNVPLFTYISRGLEHHPTAEISFYDMDGKEMSFHRSDYKPFHNAVMPSNFQEMKQIVDCLANEINSPFVRIDLYSINNQIYFSEITFSPCGGMIPFEPKSADNELGKLLKLPIE